MDREDRLTAKTVVAVATAIIFIVGAVASSYAKLAWWPSIVLWLLAMAAVTGLVIMAIEGSRTKRILSIVGVVVIFGALTPSVLHAWTIAAPARAAEQAAKDAATTARATADRLYKEAIESLRRQGVIGTAFTETEQTIEIVTDGHLRVKLNHVATSQPVMFDIVMIDATWTLVCPTTDGNWLATYDRDNWLAVVLAQTGRCPPGIR